MNRPDSLPKCPLYQKFLRAAGRWKLQAKIDHTQAVLPKTDPRDPFVLGIFLAKLSLEQFGEHILCGDE